MAADVPVSFDSGLFSSLASVWDLAVAEPLWGNQRSSGHTVTGGQQDFVQDLLGRQNIF